MVWKFNDNLEIKWTVYFHRIIYQIGLTTLSERVRHPRPGNDIFNQPLTTPGQSSSIPSASIHPSLCTQHAFDFRLLINLLPHIYVRILTDSFVRHLTKFSRTDLFGIILWSLQQFISPKNRTPRTMIFGQLLTWKCEGEEWIMKRAEGGVTSQTDVFAHFADIGPNGSTTSAGNRYDKEASLNHTRIHASISGFGESVLTHKPGAGWKAKKQKLFAEMSRDF